jgi:hypothetical protein
MPISAKFLADFTQFESATQSAGAKLRTFEGDAAKTGTALKSMSTTANAIPSVFGQIASALGPIGPMMAAAFSVTAVVNFGKQVFENADALVKLSDRTGIGTEALQRLGSIAEESGNTLEQVADAVALLQRRMTNEAAPAIKDLGLSLSDLKKQSPDQYFMTVGQAIAAITDPTERATMAYRVFGRSGSEIMATLRADMKTIADATNAMGDDVTRALDRGGDAWQRFKKNAMADLGTFLGGFILANEAFEGQVEHMKKVATMSGTMADAMKAIPPIQVATETGFKTLGKAMSEQFKDKLPPTADALRALNSQLDYELYVMNQAQKEAEELADTQIKLTAAFNDFNTTALHRSIDLMREYTSELVKSTTASGALVLAELQAQTQLNAARGLNAVGAIKLQTTALDTLIAGQEALAKTSQVGISQTAQQQVLMDAYTDALLADAVAQDKAAVAAAGVNVEVGKMPPTLRSAANEAVNAAAAFSQFTGVVTGVYTALQGLEMSSQFKYAQAGITQLGYSLGGLPPTQRRAMGGPVTGGMSYMVGELGPELFTPSGSGSIRANGAGNITVPITVQGSVFGSKQELSRAVNEAVTSALRASGVRMPTGA